MTVAEFVALALEVQKVFPPDAELIAGYEGGEFDVFSGRPTDRRDGSREAWAPFKRLGTLYMGELGQEAIQLGDWEDEDVAST